MKHILILVMAFFALSGTALGQETATERNLREQQARFEAAAKAGESLVQEFTAPRGCKPGQEQVVNDSRSASRYTFTYRDNPRWQNRRDVQHLRFRGQGLPAVGPEASYEYQVIDERREVCVTSR